MATQQSTTERLAAIEALQSRPDYILDFGAHQALCEVLSLSKPLPHVFDVKALDTTADSLKQLIAAIPEALAEIAARRVMLEQRDSHCPNIGACENRCLHGHCIGCDVTIGIDGDGGFVEDVTRCHGDTDFILCADCSAQGIRCAHCVNESAAVSAPAGCDPQCEECRTGGVAA